MRGKIFRIAIILTIYAFAALAYLSAIILPVKINTFVRDEIEKIARKRVIFQSIRFDIFEGLVIEGPVFLFDDTSVIIRAKEAACRVSIPSFLRKQANTSVIVIESPSILVERRPDNSFNITDLIPREDASKNSAINFVRGIVIKNGRIDFVDRSFEAPFRKKIERLNMNIHLMLPAKAIFSLACEIPASPSSMELKVSGKYMIGQDELDAEITANNFSPEEFKAYYSPSGFSFPRGAVNAKIGLHARDNIIYLNIDGLTKDLFVSKDAITVRLNSTVKALLRYDIGRKEAEYAGDLDIHSMTMAGIDFVGDLENIEAKVEFDDSRLSSNNIRLDAFGMPWKVKINLANFTRPILDIYADTDTELSAIKKVLDDKFKITIPTDIAGKCGVNISLEIQPDNPLKMNGYLKMRDAIISLGSGNYPIERVNGEAQFNQDTMEWSNISAIYRDVKYETSGMVKNFVLPDIRLGAISRDLSFDSSFRVNDKLAAFSRLEGKYMNSRFSAAGDVNFKDPDRPDASIKGAIDTKLEDLVNISKIPADIRGMKPAGKVRGEFELSGNVNNLKTCSINARIESGLVSIRGLKFSDIAVNYVQGSGVGHVESADASFYGGTMKAAGSVDWLSKDLSSSFNINMRDVKLEELKNYTGFKDRDVAGNIKVYANINSRLKDPSGVTGTGKITITKGRLWQLDLFKGLGALIFTSDFSDIVFTEGSCNFRVENKEFSTTDFSLKSELMKLYGSVKIGFDKSITASLRSELAEGAMYPGAQKNIAAAIGSCTFTEISGTLMEPKYKTRLSIDDV